MATDIRSTRSSVWMFFTWAIILPLATLGLLSLRTSLPPIISSPSAGSNLSAIPTMTSFSFLDTVKARRTWYALDKKLPIDQIRISRIVEEAIQTVPTPFNSQSNRAVVLLGAEHEKLWDIVSEILKARVSEDQWVSTEQKTAGFTAAAGTILLFVDDAVVETYSANIPTYAAQFPIWALQADAMLQHTIWTALSAEGLGANLQHYNPLIDSKVREAWNLPASWRLTAQLVFGGRVGPEPAIKEKFPLEQKLKSFGALASL